MEIWKDISGYEGLYQVSNKGRVKSFNYQNTGREKIIKPYTDYKGYKHYTLWKNSSCKRFQAHRLVALHFIENPHSLPFVNHKDENPANNFVENLEWCTPKYNSNYGTSRQRSQEKRAKQVMLVETGQIFKDAYEASEYSHISPKAIMDAANGRRKTAGGCQWRYIGQNSQNGKRRKVRCVETRQVFSTKVSAAKFAGVSSSTLCGCLSGKSNTSGGYHWEYVED